MGFVLIVPRPAGLTFVVSRYCAVKFAVYVAEPVGALKDCDNPPPFDHVPNTYCVPGVVCWVACVAIVCGDPAAHVNVWVDALVHAIYRKRQPAGSRTHGNAHGPGRRQVYAEVGEIRGLACEHRDVLR